MSQPYSQKSIAAFIVVALLFFIPATSKMMIALVLMATPATIIVWGIGMLLGRVPMLLAAGLSITLLVGAMFQMLFSLQ